MVKVNLIGFKEFEKKLQKAPADIQRKGDQLIKFAGERFRELAIFSLSSGVLKFPTGQLAGSIHLVDTGKLKVEVVVGKKYGPYVEWGTITHAAAGVAMVNDLAGTDLSAYAILFKGRGIRKTGGMLPRPYFFKHIQQVRKETIEEFKTLLKDVI